MRDAEVRAVSRYRLAADAGFLVAA